MSARAIDSVSIRAAMRQPSGFVGLLVLVWLLVCAHLLHSYWSATAVTVPDIDDAMRLAQWRDFLNGQGWFDLRQSRLSPPQGYESHWSRLIDAGLAGLYFFFRLFADDPMAERLMRAIWPLLWILPAIAGVAGIAWRLAGMLAAVAALLLTLAGGSAYQQFLPGTIDHHNVQIALTMLTVAATVWSDRTWWSAAAAGLLSALSIAIGLETLPYLAVCGAAISLRFVVLPAGAHAARHYALSLAAGLLVLFFATLTPERWRVVQCDALAPNLMAAILSPAVLLALATIVKPSDVVWRVVFVAFATATALAAVAWIEPRCFLGPYGLMDQRLWPLWLSSVFENQPLAIILGSNPFRVLPMLIFPAASLVAVAVFLCGQARRDFAGLTACAVFLMGWLTVYIAIRAAPYVIWLGVPVMAAMVVTLLPADKGVGTWRAFAAALLLSPLLLGSVATLVMPAKASQVSSSGEQSRACRLSANIRELAVLPPGLIVTDVFHGAHILALTRHRVVSAPFHRLSVGTILAHRILAGAPDEARDVARRAGVTYIALCGPRPPDGLSEEQRKRGLWSYLEVGAVPDWLDPVASTVGRPFTVYRVLP